MTDECELSEKAKIHLPCPLKVAQIHVPPAEPSLCRGGFLSISVSPRVVATVTDETLRTRLSGGDVLCRPLHPVSGAGAEGPWEVEWRGAVLQAVELRGPAAGLALAR